MLDHNHKEPTNEEFADTPRKKGGFLRAVTTPFGWLLRMVLGPSKSLTEDPASTKWESPSRLALGSFFRRKLAVAALAVLLALFLFVFVGPLFLPMDVNYTDALQANIAPNYAMLSLPRALKGQIRDINGYANFTVGVSNDNRLFMWGYTKDLITGLDYSDFPAEIR
ncbi:MAG: hypothetical protein IJW89_01675, partial [Clostridia bacterium]|nr:hypothetical protein [Clostridia bacterium]